ncbi:MAG: IS1595 family transposase [Candidatus Thiodiazotropha sp.]
MKTDVDNIFFEDFQNPWTFHFLFTQADPIVFAWLRHNGLLPEIVQCSSGEVAKLNHRQKVKDGFSFRCTKGHEYGMRKFSFFEGSPFNIRDLIIFMKYYVEGHTLKQCAIATSMDYKSTAVNWGSYMREIFMEYIYNTYQDMKFGDDVEIDESLFGRKIKYNRGKPSGQKIWIFGIIERKSNLIILYPVDNRNANTLIPLIQKHVSPGTRIYSDNWAAYLKLNDLGYEHFTVTHKTTFKQVYRNMDTGNYVVCHTNRIEGAWKICKDHFRKINGTNTKLFEQHLCEVVWRNHVHKTNIYRSFFDLLKSVYTLTGDAKYHHQTPVFGTWTPPSTEDEEAHSYTIIQDPDENSSSDDEILSAPTEEHPQQSPESVHSEDTSNPASILTVSHISETSPTSNQSDESDSTIESRSASIQPSTSEPSTSTPHAAAHAARTKELSLHESQYETDTDTESKHCHPYRFVTLRKKRDNAPKKHPIKSNVYGKEAYQYDFSSSDSDFA